MADKEKEHGAHHERGAMGAHGMEHMHGGGHERAGAHEHGVAQGSGAGHVHGAGHEHGTGGHAGMLADFRRRFIVSLALTIPILLLSHMFRNLVGFGTRFEFHGDIYLLFAVSSAVFVYGGYPFLAGLRD